jgi:hypothetical protein
MVRGGAMQPHLRGAAPVGCRVEPQGFLACWFAAADEHAREAA